MLGLNIGVSAIRANQVALRTAGHNLVNAETEGYHRQRVDLQSRPEINLANYTLGTGVEVAQIRRLLDISVERGITQNQAATANAQTRLDAWPRVETLITPGTGGLDERVAAFITSLEQLSSRPTEAYRRTEALQTAEALTESVNQTLDDLNRLTASLRAEVRATVDQANILAEQITETDNLIRIELGVGRQPNDLLDRREQLINELSGLVGVNTNTLDVAHGPAVAADGWLILSDGAARLEVTEGPYAQFDLTLTNDETPITLSSGKLSGLLTALEDVQAVRGDIESWFQDLRIEFDHIQATGLGMEGPFRSAQSARSVEFPATPIANLGLPAEISSGELHITVTNPATQQRTTHRVAIDVHNDSMAEVVARIDALAGVSAFLDPASGQATIAGTGQNLIDFAGRIDQAPQTSAVTGTSQPTLGGLYTGEGNAIWSVTALDSGEIGVTQPLRLEVRDAATGELVTTVDAGLGYEPGQPVQLRDGVTLAMGVGTLNAGDQFETSVVADPDETRLLAALGIRSFFTDGPDGHFSVNQALLNDPDRLSTSRSGLPGDAANLDRMVALRDAPLYEGGETIELRLATMISTTGVKTQAVESELDQLEALGARLMSDRDAVSGVDMNEELMQMLRFQQAFGAAAKFVSEIDETVQSLFDMVR
jgi:flagellar hook-associated protein FlgK